MQQLSQRDPKWSNIRLGWGSTNTSTIGSHGCTITCVAMLAGLTPKEVNERLIAVQGYAAHKNTPNTFNLINWQKIEAAIPWLKFEFRGYGYDNTRVSDAIQKNSGCLVAVDATKIGGGSVDGHWVLYKGNQKMNDPIDGQEKPTTHYPATGYSIINVIGTKPVEDTMPNMYKGYDLTNAESMKVAVDMLVRVMSGEFIEKTKYEADLNSATDHCNVRVSDAQINQNQLTIATIRDGLGLPKEIADTSGLISAIKALITPPKVEEAPSGSVEPSLPATIDGDWVENGMSIEITEGNKKTTINYAKA